MKLADYEPRSDVVRQWWTKARTEGLTEGRADLLARMLTRRFGTLPDDTRARLAASSIDELDAIGERLLSAQTLQEVLAQACPKARLSKVGKSVAVSYNSGVLRRCSP
jgi:hypothetical protein